MGVAAARTQGQGVPQRGYSGGGGRVRLDFFLNEKTPEHFAQQAVRQALIQLDAVPAPAGEMTVVLGPGWPGILLHEAVGHGLEADFNRKGVSAFSDRIGQQVASPLCTVVDDGSIRDRRGSLNVDDEGNPTQQNVLIENGVLRGYLQDKLSSRITRSQPTGSGRRESYQHIPMPRMTNTFMLAGESDPEEIIRSVPKGLYCANFGGGQVDITSGNFVFSASESYLIEDGHITTPVRGATLIGNGPEALKYVSHGRERSEAGRRCGGLRQRRTERTGRGRNPDHQTRSDDGRRHGLNLEELASRVIDESKAGGATGCRVHRLGRRTFLRQRSDGGDRKSQGSGLARGRCSRSCR